MENKRLKPWYGVWGGRYTGDQPPFYDKEELPWVKILEGNWEVMRDELMDLLGSKPKRLKPYYINHAMSFPPKRWKTMGLFFWKFMFHKNCKMCPKTMEILKTIPNLTSFSISILEPGSNINPHIGDTDAVIRCHIGIEIPGTLPDLGFQVGSEIRAWEEGKALPFCDAITHTAWNHTDKRRAVLILDVMRPEFASRQNSICANVLASSIIQMLYPKLSILRDKSGYVRKLIYHICRVAIYIYLPIQRNLAFSRWF